MNVLRKNCDFKYTRGQRDATTSSPLQVHLELARRHGRHLGRHDAVEAKIGQRSSQQPAREHEKLKKKNQQACDRPLTNEHESLGFLLGGGLTRGACSRYWRLVDICIRKRNLLS